MKHIIEHYKPTIQQRLRQLCDSTQDSRVPWAEDVAKRLFDFCQRGKMVRGSIVLYTSDLFASPWKSEAVDIAASIELLHAALLVHDDLIDHDRLRRGKESIHVQYEQVGIENQIPNAKDFGEGMAVCGGDIAIFGAFSHLSSLELTPTLHQAIMKLITREFLTVGFGEIHDIALGYLPTIPTPDDVLSMYLRKTARYTFSLPFMIGAILGEQKDTIIQQMTELGEHLGMIYQLQDDLLTISGDQQLIGKTVGNDISENKKTYAAVLLWNRVNDSEKLLLKGIFGKQALETSEIGSVLNLLKKHRVIDDIQEQIENYATKANSIISSLPLDSNKQAELNELLTFLKTRDK